MKIINPEYSVEKIVERMKKTAARQAKIPVSHSTASGNAAASWEDWSAARSEVRTDGEINVPEISLQPTFQPRNDDTYHVRDLLKYHDRNFIQNAYSAILKRDPDAAGYQALIEALRSGGLNKIDILARLRYSAEGRTKKVRTEGLILPSVIRTAYRIPILGYLLNLAVGVARLPLMIQNQRRFEAHTLAQLETIAAFANQLGRGADSIGHSLQTQHEALVKVHTAAYESLLKRVAELTSSFEERLDTEASERRQQLLTLSQDIRRAVELTSSLEERLDTEASERRQQLLAISQDIQRAAELTSSFAERLDTEASQRFQKQQQVSSELVLQNQRLTRVLEEVQKRSPAPFDRDQLQLLAQEQSHALDAFYASFDEAFRGSREEIKERLQVYLPVIEQRGIGFEATPILDVGSGRGEWLELLKEERLHAAGVDNNRILIAQCRARGLEVVEDDLIEYVRRLPDGSLGGVTGFHIAEHLPIETLVNLLDETVRILKPGGVVIFETPNPQNVLVGSCNFYFDPTHRNPLPSQVLKFLIESRGFEGIELLNLNPSDEAPVAGDSDLAKRFNQYFYGPMDYAVIGWKIPDRPQAMDD